MPSCRSTSSIRTIAVIDSVPSLIASVAVCECASMMPGVTYLPVPSMTFAPGGHGDVGADRGDLAVADEDRAVLIVAVRRRHDGRVGDRDEPPGGRDRQRNGRRSSAGATTRRGPVRRSRPCSVSAEPARNPAPAMTKDCSRGDRIRRSPVRCRRSRRAHGRLLRRERHRSQLSRAHAPRHSIPLHLALEGHRRPLAADLKRRLPRRRSGR